MLEGTEDTLSENNKTSSLTNEPSHHSFPASILSISTTNTLLLTHFWLTSIPSYFFHLILSLSASPPWPFLPLCAAFLCLQPLTPSFCTLSLSHSLLSQLGSRPCEIKSFFSKCLDGKASSCIRYASAQTSYFRSVPVIRAWRGLVVQCQQMIMPRLFDIQSECVLARERGTQRVLGKAISVDFFLFFLLQPLQCCLELMVGLLRQHIEICTITRAI